jgi:hypothetical protein
LRKAVILPVVIGRCRFRSLRHRSGTVVTICVTPGRVCVTCETCVTLCVTV